MHAEGLGEIEETLVQEAALAVLDVDEDVAGDPRIQRQLLLGHAALDPQIPHPSAHGVPDPCPNRRTFWIGLTGACRHAPQLLRGRTKSLPY